MVLRARFRCLQVLTETKFSFPFYLSILLLPSGNLLVIISDSHFFSLLSKNRKRKYLFIYRKKICLVKFRASSENFPDTAPLTIFYNGTVSIFDVPRDKVGLYLL
jgi:hypothetical protein